MVTEKRRATTDNVIRRFSQRCLIVLSALAIVLLTGSFAIYPLRASLSLPDLDRVGNLTIRSTDLQGYPAVGTYTLYRVLRGPDGAVVLETAADWQRATEWISAANGRIAANDLSVTALESKATGTNGTLTFSNLRPGIYYVAETDGGSVTSLPFLVMIPSWDTSSETWQWAVTAAPKAWRNLPSNTDSAAPFWPTKAPTSVFVPATRTAHPEPADDFNVLEYLRPLTHSGASIAVLGCAILSIAFGLGVAQRARRNVSRP